MENLLAVQEAAVDQLHEMHMGQLETIASSSSAEAIPSSVCMPCRRMALELSTAAENILTENHDVALALEASTLALAVLELHSRIIDRGSQLLKSSQSTSESRNITLCIEFLPSVISFQEQTTKLLQTIQAARDAYAAQMQDDESLALRHEPGPKILHAAHANLTSSARDWGCAMSCVLLHNSGIAYSKLLCSAAALQAYMVALSSASLMNDQDKACAIKCHVLRQVEDIASKVADSDPQTYRSIEDIRHELRNAEVSMLSRCPSAARAA